MVMPQAEALYLIVAPRLRQLVTIASLASLWYACWRKCGQFALHYWESGAVLTLRLLVSLGASFGARRGGCRCLPAIQAGSRR
jgi:hypothetical protein